MAALLMIKEKIKTIYADYHRVIVPVIKAVVAFLMLTAIKTRLAIWLVWRIWLWY